MWKLGKEGERHWQGSPKCESENANKVKNELKL